MNELFLVWLYDACEGFHDREHWAAIEHDGCGTWLMVPWLAAAEMYDLREKAEAALADATHHLSEGRERPITGKVVRFVQQATGAGGAGMTTEVKSVEHICGTCRRWQSRNGSGGRCGRKITITVEDC